MNRPVSACVGLCVLLSSVLTAQRGFPPVDIRGVEPLEFGEVVRGAPFSAEAVTEMTQELRDGNRIERRSTVVIARDGAGRTRREQALPAIGPFVPDANLRMITISDPRQKVLYLLDPQRKTAARSTPPSGPPSLPRGDRAPGDMALPPPQVSSEALGQRQIFGLRADGTRQTMTVPAGVFGNVAPLDVVTDRWYSPELKIVLESRRSDPRMGNVTYRVTSLVRGEPDPALFEIPSDYTVVDRPGPPFRRGPGPPP
jgi:hypothetical protein